MKLRLPRLRKEKDRSFRLFVDAEDAPPDRWFGSLAAALRAADGLEERWRSRAWVMEYHDQPSFGGMPVIRNVVHLRNGERVEEAEAGSSGG